MLNLGLRIRELRKYLKINQATFAEKLGITGSYKTRAVIISRWERGERRPDAIYLTKMAVNFKAGINWLLTGMGPMFMEYPYENAAQEIAEEGIPYLTADEWKIINLLRENPEVTGLVLKLLGGRKSVKEALEELLRIPDHADAKP
jgi:transcriptional regulator with XRE-family HTH domain